MLPLFALLLLATVAPPLAAKPTTVEQCDFYAKRKPEPPATPTQTYTYRNLFSFEVPGDYVVVNERGTLVVYSFLDKNVLDCLIKNDIRTDIVLNAASIKISKAKSLKDYRKKAKTMYDFLTNFKTATTNGYPTLVFNTDGMFESKNFVLLAPKGDYVVDMGWITDREKILYKDAARVVMSTFRFLP